MDKQGLAEAIKMAFGYDKMEDDAGKQNIQSMSEKLAEAISEFTTAQIEENIELHIKDEEISNAHS